MISAAPPSSSSVVGGSRSTLANGFSMPVTNGSMIGNKSKPMSIAAGTSDKKRASTVYTSGGDSDTATFDQLMGEIHSNGCILRKRNWDRNNSAGNTRSQNDRSTMSATNHWSQNPADNVWSSSDGNCLQSPYRSMVVDSTAKAASSNSSKSPKDEAKDITFWTNVFFNNAAANELGAYHSINNNSPSTNATSANKHGRKSSATSIVIGQLLNDKSLANEQNAGNAASSSSSSYLYATDDSGAGAAAAAIATTSYENTGRYAAIQSGIKRKNNLSKTKISTNLNGESERLPKSTDLFLLPSSSGGRIYSSLGMTDVSPSTDGSRFIQVG